VLRLRSIGCAGAPCLCGIGGVCVGGGEGVCLRGRSACLESRDIPCDRPEILDFHDFVMKDRRPGGRCLPPTPSLSSYMEGGGRAGV
jgi:hypothetical protein